MNTTGGVLNIVGIGPGNDDHITPAALQAIKDADIVIGYSTYISLVRHHLGGKQVTRTGMTEEITRAQMAVETAASGKTVTLISSGDAGVYGMAGLVFEVLRRIGWKRGQSPDLRLIPGITAANSCAALVGAPLIHDSCRISLSDLLTPWPVIESRIERAAEADFVISLYNPASGRRQRQIVEAARIIKKYRPGTTPVALIKSAYRRQQNIVLSDLDHFLEFEIGMNTTVIIGSSQTFVYEGFMVTPRGYANKYSLADGSVNEGQRRAFSLRCEGDINSKAANQEAAPKLNVTKIQNVFMRPETSIFADESIPTEEDTSPAPIEPSADSSATMALAALQILNQSRQSAPLETSQDRFASEDPSGDSDTYLGRLKGALLCKSGSRYFLIGNLKEPCSFEEHGFRAPASIDGGVIELSVVDAERVADIPLTFFVGPSKGQGAEVLPFAVRDRFIIHRNSSISERLLTLVKENSSKVQKSGREMVDARWLMAMPLPVWSIAREEVLKCR